MEPCDNRGRCKKLFDSLTNPNLPFDWSINIVISTILCFKDSLCGRTFVSASNQVLFALGRVRIDLRPTRTNLLNPTLGRDVSHPCLISLWPKERCTIVCVNSLHSCSSSWVKRGCNSVAHVVAKLSLASLESFCFNKLGLPEALVIICKIDCSSFFSS